MNALHQMSKILVLSVSALLASCNDKAAVASPECADLHKTNDPSKRAELAKRCPRGGTVFRPSEKKTW